MSQCITRRIQSPMLRQARRLPSRPPAQRRRQHTSSRQWSAARPRSARSSRQRPEPGRAQLPLPISGPAIMRKSRGRRRRRTPLFQAMPDTRCLHGYGDRIFGPEGVSDQRSDGPDCGGQYRFGSRNRYRLGPLRRSPHLLHVADRFGQQQRPHRCNGLGDAEPRCQLRRHHHCRSRFVSGPAKPWGTVSNCPSTSAGLTERAASTLPRCFAAAPMWAHVISRQRPTRAATLSLWRSPLVTGQLRDGMSIRVPRVERLKPMPAPMMAV